MNNSKGKLIVIDGTDGSGKATQTKLLIQYLRDNGYQVVTFDFPHHNEASGYFVDKYLTGAYGNAQELGAYAPSVLFAVDRFDTKLAIEQALESGSIVVCDRWVTANLAHQGGKIADDKERADYYRWDLDLEYTKMKLPQPDLNLILHVPCAIGQELVDHKASRAYLDGAKRDIHEADIEHLRQAEKVYLELNDLLPNTVLIECAPSNVLLSIEEIAVLVSSEVDKFLVI